MGTYNTPDDLLERIRRLEAKVDELTRAAPIRNASISDGGRLQVKGVTGRSLVAMGRSDDPTLVAPDGHKQMAVFINRETGEPAFAMYDPLPNSDGFHQFWALYDRAGNVLVGDDTTSGQGLARPYVPFTFNDYAPVPTNSTTSGSFVTVCRAAAVTKQHPQIKAGLTAVTSATTTGEVRLWDATHSVQLGATISLPAGTYQDFSIGPVPLTGAHMDTVDIDIQARRLTGTGTVAVRGTSGYGVQS